jgi:hypothetical protein
MRRTPALVALALPALLLATHAASAQPTDAAEVGMIFCKDLIEDTEPMGLLTPHLIHLIGDAVARNAEIQAATPDEKPPLGDGIPWASWPDRADRCAVEETAVSATEARLAVTYSFDDFPDASFTDTLVLKPTPLGWFIDDIVFIDQLTLRAVLTGVLEQ